MVSKVIEIYKVGSNADNGSKRGVQCKDTAVI
jgi:hypothetical protein